jgi:rsbT co-antagonist protein RsbR
MSAALLPAHTAHESELRRRNKLVRRLSISLASVTSSYLVIILVLGGIDRDLMVVELLSTFAFMLLAWSATRSFRWSPELLVVATLTHTVIASTNSGGVAGIGPAIFFVVLVVAGMVLRPVGNLICGGISIAAIVMLAWLTVNDLVVYPTAVPMVVTSEGIIRYTVVYILLTSLVSVLAFMNARSYEQALHHLADQSEAVAQKNTRLTEQSTLLLKQAAELAQQREMLEYKVQLRTADLQSALDEVRRSAIALRELQSPIVPIADGVLVLPLVGAFDNARAHQFVQDILQGVELRRAHTVLLDVTGLPVMDALAARTLVDAAAAVQLLGAKMILVGIAPAVAQTIVGLGIDLRDLNIERDLQSVVERVVGKHAVLV